MSNVTLASPWVIYAKKVEALFSGDKDVTVIFDNDNVKLTIYATGLGGKKAEAIRQLFPDTVQIGNVTLTIEVIPGNVELTFDEIVNAAFNGNENFVGIESQSHGIFGNTSYGLFKNKAVQFYSDDLTQYDGMDTIVIADIARELIPCDNGFYFSTEIE